MVDHAALHPVHYLPIATTVLAAIFATILLRRYFTKRSGLHLLWWGMGIVAYGIGTGLESAITLFGNSFTLTKAWYIAGALFGGYPLAQGTVYLLLKRRTAHILTAITLPFILVTAILVILSPVNADALEAIRPTGSVLGWSWVRLMTPFINIYAVIFLVGGAILSAWRYFRQPGDGHSHRAIGNTLIAIGGILPGIGGTMAKAGIVEALYVGEFVGLLFIWAGFTVALRGKPIVRPAAEPSAA
ncbi:MAG: hypothetical protein AAFX09_07670 [Pseudomonadota bacterium]